MIIDGGSFSFFPYLHNSVKPRHHKAVLVRKNSKSTTECVARNAPSVHNDKAVAVVCPDGDNVPTPRIYVTLVGGGWWIAGGVTV